ncbi:MAG: prepilin-type N-terminal cleavage/methylation domain-containing protein [Gammaproteobacteria bacterium]|nr:prepilin-type N-terminal cleavage/methylation domain-containing protein [Gammaproteobacteria bacterium]
MKTPARARGFTLTELMITVAIIGIIITIAMPFYQDYVLTSRQVEAQNDIETLKAAQAEFFAENGTYFIGANAAALTAASGNLWEPAKPVANREFTYAVTLIAATTGPPPTPVGFNVIATGAGNNVPNTVTIEFPTP